jgi:fatty-acyl-CoA synthase
MKGLMMDTPLTLQYILERARRLFPKQEIATKFGTEMHRYTYADFYERVGCLANALARLGVRPGDRVATLAWNTYRHLELYFAVPCSGAVLHTLNLRLPADQLIYIINHAEDRVIFIDQTLLPILEKIAPHLESVKCIVVMGGPDPAAENFLTTLPCVSNYEALLAAESSHFDWPRIDENDAAGMCYTSGTTGNPKGVLYSHRAIYLHSFAECMADGLALSGTDTLMPVVPMFHVMAWGMPFTALLVGAKHVYPGPHLQPRDLAELIQLERVTATAGVPTLWLGLLNLLENERYDLSSLRAMVVGGAAAPRSMIERFQRQHNLRILHAWGMTETTPLGTIGVLKHSMRDWPEDRQFDVRAKQGIPVAGVEIRGVDEEGREIPWDGQTQGELEVRGPWIIKEYYRDERTAGAFHDGWFRTGDVVTIDEEGYMQIVDRVKDLVKSGGEWISSVALENAIMAHPKVAEAAVIAVPHPKWQERPLACVVPRPNLPEPLRKDDIYELLARTFPKWELPDDIVFIDAVPKTSVGKFDKKVLRKQYAEYRLPTI